MKVKIKLLDDKARVPYKAHVTDAGFDITATRCYYEGNNIVYGTGLAFEIPEGHVGLLFPRSSNANKDLALTNSVGVVDAGYRGEVLFKYRIQPSERSSRIYTVGERVGQLIIMPIPAIEFEQADELADSERGVGGYGSSGK